jgi:hypothetical protein
MKTFTIEAANAENAWFNLITALIFWVLAILAAWWMHSGYGICFTLNINSRDFCPVIFVPVVFILIGLFFSGRALLDGLRVRKYGRTTLEAGEVFLGGSLTGTIRTTYDLEPLGDYTLRLRCIETVGSGSVSDKNYHHIDELRWEGLGTVKHDSVHSSQGIPVDIPIPEGSGALVTVPGSEIGTATGVRWVLEIRAPLRGLDYYALFLIIVRQRHH